jgi:2-oxoglutarate ferredoxin oxidoreductase subunit delta
MSEQQRSRGTVVIEADRCKGCELCIPACPVGVLQMSTMRNEKGYFVPELLQGCTGCSACQLICPDYVFDIYRYNRSATAGAA